MTQAAQLEEENHRLRQAMVSQGGNVNEQLASFPSGQLHHQPGSFFGNAPAQGRMEQISFMDLIPENQAHLLGFGNHGNEDSPNSNNADGGSSSNHEFDGQSFNGSTLEQDQMNVPRNEGLEFLPSPSWFQNSNQLQPLASCSSPRAKQAGAGEERGRSRTRISSSKDFSPDTKNRVKQLSKDLKSHLSARIPSPSSLLRESITQEQLESQQREVEGLTSPISDGNMEE